MMSSATVKRQSLRSSGDGQRKEGSVGTKAKTDDGSSADTVERKEITAVAVEMLLVDDMRLWYLSKQSMVSEQYRSKIVVVK